MTRPARLLPGSFALVLACSAPVLGQAADTPPAHVSYSDGVVVVEHDATAEDAGPNTPLLPGDRIRTEAGRAELLFGDGSVVHLDEYTSVDLLSESLLRLLGGRVAVVAGSGLAGQLQVDAAAASVRVLSAGEYRVSLLPRGDANDLELAVIRGSAELIGDTDSLTLRAGERAVASLGAPPAGPWPFNSARFDAFDRWSRDRLDARRGPSSYEHVPAELHAYAGTFDSYGWWDYQPTYGYVWYPRVDYGWRPYYHGRWKHYRRLGWTWIGGPRWAWPTHHYGRWGVTSAGAWFWIPGRTWGSAWVHWGVAPGYVSWCPLGFDNRPVFAFWSHRSPRHYNPWRGWTVVHRSHFGGRRHVNASALDGHRLVSTRGSTFVTQGTAPTFRGVRSGRLSAGTDAPVAVPRGSAAPSRRGDRGGGTLSATPSRRPRSLAAAASSGGTEPASTTGATGTRLNTDAPGDRRGSIGRAVPRDSSTTAGRTWRPDDVPVYRGGRRADPDATASGRSGSSPPSGVRSEEAPSSAAPDAPTYRRSPGGWGSGGAIAVPRGDGGSAGDRGDGGSRGDGGGARRTEGPSRGSVGVPSAPSTPPAAPPPSSGAGASGGHERRAPEGSRGIGRAVPRGSSDSGGGGGRDGGARDGGGRMGGRSRR